VWLNGKSTAFEIFLCWTILFQKDQRVGILANKAEQSRDILRKVKEAYEMLPKWLQQGVRVWNSGSIKLENGSMVIAASTSSTAIRGKSIGLLVVDERAFIPLNIWNDFISSVYPTISSSPTSKVIYVSTPNGLNHFYQDWTDAIDGKNEFNPIRVDWWEVPGRDENWKEETINNIGQIRFNQEYSNSFLGSIATLIEPEYIREMKHSQEIKHSNIKACFSKKIQDSLFIYEEPIKGHEYVIGVDSAKMTEDNAGDALGMQILDVTTLPFKQVGTFFAKSGVSYLQAPEIVCQLGNYYNVAMLFIENNEIGQEVANICHFDMEYDNVYFNKGNLAGYRTDKRTKRMGCSNLKILLESNKLIINDFNTISQISTFIRVKTSYKAESGYQDDLVMSLIGALYFMIAKGIEVAGLSSDKILDTFNNSNMLEMKNLEKDNDDDLPPLGFLPEDDIENDPFSIF